MECSFNGNFLGQPTEPS